MEKRIVIRTGDIFMVQLEDCQCYFQYIIDDKSELSSNVIKIFKRKYPLGSTPDFEELADIEAECYAHTNIRIGVKQHLWEKVGKASVHDSFDAKFIDDYDPIPDLGMKRWQVWILNNKRFKCDELPDDYKKADMGGVIPPKYIVYRIKYGKHFGYWDDPTHPRSPLYNKQE